MMYYLVRLEHHHITEEFGTCGDNDPYDHYIGDIHERTNLRFKMIRSDEYDNLLDCYIPEDPYDYETVEVICEFYSDHEVKRFINCVKTMVIE